MTGQQLIDLIQAHKLQDFEMTASFSEPTTSEWGVNYRTFTIDKIIADIGYSDKTAKLGLTEQF